MDHTVSIIIKCCIITDRILKIQKKIILPVKKMLNAEVALFIQLYIVYMWSKGDLKHDSENS